MAYKVQSVLLIGYFLQRICFSWIALVQKSCFSFRARKRISAQVELLSSYRVIGFRSEAQMRATVPWAATCFGRPWRSKTEIAPSDQRPEIGHRATKIHGELQMPNLRSQGSQSLYFHSKKEQMRCLDDFAYVVMLFGPKSSGKLRVQQHQPV